MLEGQTSLIWYWKLCSILNWFLRIQLIRISYATKIVPKYSNCESLYLGLFPCISAPKVLSFTPNSPVDDCSSGTTTVASSNSAVEKPQDNNGFHDQVHWVPAPGTPWSYNPWVSMPGYPLIQFYPSPYWNSIPWLPPATCTPNFSHLGKHSSDQESIKPNEEPKKQKNSVLIPKTLRIDDPDEAAKSSI